MKSKIALGLAIASIAGFASSYALANPTKITLGDGWSSPTFSGGEFKATVTGGTSAPFQAASVLYGGASFITFCLEKTETFSWNQTLFVKGPPGTGALNGGAGRDAMYTGDVAGTGTSSNGFDPISTRTAYLYTQFSKGTLSNYDYGNASLRQGDADALQNAFWYLENELGAQSTSLFNSLSAQTKAWINEADTKIANNMWSGIGNVRVLNLYKNYNPTTGAYSNVSQDQLYMITPVPEPETYAMMLAGLGLIGFFGNRRRRKLV